MFPDAALRFPEYTHIDQRIAEAAETTGQAKYAIVSTGTTIETELEGYDRDTRDLPRYQEALISIITTNNLRPTFIYLRLEKYCTCLSKVIMIERSSDAACHVRAFNRTDLGQGYLLRSRSLFHRPLNIHTGNSLVLS